MRSSDGVALSCWSAGQGPETLLLVHGWDGSGSGRFWTPLLQHLDLSGIRVIAIDQNSCGQIVNRIPSARLAVLNCGHEIPLEKPLECAGLIEAFVGGYR